MTWEQSRCSQIRFVSCMHNGENVEFGAAEEIFNNPKKEYTKFLVSSRLSLTHSFELAMEGVDAFK